MSYLAELGTIFFDLSMPSISMTKKVKDTGTTFKGLDRLCDQIVFEKEIKKSFFRVTEYPEGERLKDIGSLLGRCISYFHARDALYNRVLSILKNDKIGGKQRQWAWRLLCVMIRYMAPSRALLASLSVEGLGGEKEHIAYVNRHIKLAKLTSPTYLMPTAEEIKFVGLQAAFVKPVFGTRLDELDESLLIDLQGVKVPKIVVKLSEAILRWNGCSTEGLFRIPSDLRSFENLRHSLERGDYHVLEMEKGDPIAAASVLKSWLRSLDEPVIPSAFHSKIVEEHCPPSQLIMELPERNRSTLRCVLSLLQTVSTPTSQSGTRMSVDALASIFVPNLIRGTEREERMQASKWTKAMSEHSKTERDFVCQLIKHVK